MLIYVQAAAARGQADGLPGGHHDAHPRRVLCGLVCAGIQQDRHPNVHQGSCIACMCLARDGFGLIHGELDGCIACKALVRADLAIIPCIAYVSLLILLQLGYTLYRRVLGYYSGEEDAYDMRKAMPRDVLGKSVIPLDRPVHPHELEHD